MAQPDAKILIHPSPLRRWMCSAALFIMLTAFDPGARPVDEATEATRIQGSEPQPSRCTAAIVRATDARHEQPPNHGAPPTLVVAIAATTLEPDDDVGCRVARPWMSGWLRRLR
jgi:hypothetical protein